MANVKALAQLRTWFGWEGLLERVAAVESAKLITDPLIYYLGAVGGFKTEARVICKD
jgi:hypothetical protein